MGFNKRYYEGGLSKAQRKEKERAITQELRLQHFKRFKTMPLAAWCERLREIDTRYRKATNPWKYSDYMHHWVILALDEVDMYNGKIDYISRFSATWIKRGLKKFFKGEQQKNLANYMNAKWDYGTGKPKTHSMSRMYEGLAKIALNQMEEYCRIKNEEEYRAIMKTIDETESNKFLKHNPHAPGSVERV